MSKTVILWVACVGLSAAALGATERSARIRLADHWRLQSSWQMKEDGDVISTEDYAPKGWYPTRVPSTVYSALVRNKVYPDIRIGMNSFRTPDASDEFNQKHDLAKYSHLAGQRNPWTDPYWFRTEFPLPASERGRRVWLNFDGIHYRADVWLNGRRVADAGRIAGSFSRYRLDATQCARFDQTNCLAVKIHPMDHPGVPDTQIEVFGKDRAYQKESMKDVGLAMFIGYDNMPTVPDRNMGLLQQVYVDFSGPVEIRDPFVAARLPLPQTSPASLKISAVLANVSDETQEGLLKGEIDETGGRFEQRVRLSAGETKELAFSPDEHPALTVAQPRLWWPRNYGPQHLYHLRLKFEAGGTVSHEKRVEFGIRQITREMHVLDGAHGLRLHINGQKVFCRGGYIHPEVLFEWDARRIEAEIRYLAEANLNMVYFEDIPNPPEPFLECCDRYGLMFGNCFYGCYWMQPGKPYPLDLDLLFRGTVDIIHRYRNHPSLVLYMAMNEGETREDVYTRWRQEIIRRDGTRLWIPSGSFPDYRKNVPPWIQPDLPTGMNDYRPKSYGWVGPAQYFRWVREERNWMFMLESGCPSPPPIDSLLRFIPDAEEGPAGPTFPVTPAWAHHDACHYFQPYDAALRQLYGQPKSLLDYLARAVLLSADEHRAMFEAANHRMWDITSGFSQWKLNACWPSVEWQLYDYYLRPLATYFYIKKACEPLHVQLTPLDLAVTVVNNRLEAKPNLRVRARVYDFASRLRWEGNASVDMPANCYREVLAIPSPGDLGPTPVYFVKLELTDDAGKVVSDNFYWLASKAPTDLASLEDLPRVRLESSLAVRPAGRERIAEVLVKNPTDRVALFAHLVLTKGPRGEEILPVLWDDNYFSLAPGESRTISARLAAEDVGAATPALEVGGWNIESPLDCRGLKVLKAEVRASEPLTVTAAIESTFLDGDRIDLLVDDKVVEISTVLGRGREWGGSSILI